MLLDQSAITLTSLKEAAGVDGDGEQFLRFHLVPKTTAVLPIAQIVEVLTIPRGRIVPIPQMPPWVMGVYNWRGEILWMVDLGHCIGLTSWYEKESTAAAYTAIVLSLVVESIDSGTDRADPNKSNYSLIADQKTGRKMVGLTVKRVEDIDWFNPDLIQSPPASAVSPQLVQFLRGYWVRQKGEMVVVLEGEAILTALGKL